MAKEPVKLISINIYLSEDGKISHELMKATKLDDETFISILDKWYEVIRDKYHGKTKKCSN